MASATIATKLYCLEPADPPRLALRETAVPAPGSGQVLVRVAAAAVNPIDVKRATGYGQRLLTLKGAGRFPLVLGNDFAGVVEAVGPGVRRLQPGDPVFGLLPTGKGGGTHGTHALADARWVRHAPSRCPAEMLAVLPYTFTTLWQALRAAGLTQDNARDRKILVHGASGGLGLLALQVLNRWGASATAVCGTDNIDLCRSFGAAELWDRKRRDLAALPAHFDAGLNFGAWQDEETLIGRLKRGALGHATTVHPLLANFDRYGWIGGALSSRRDFRRVRALATAKGALYGWTVFRPEEPALDALHELLSDNALRLPIGIQAPLPEARLAFDHVARGATGRAVLTVHSQEQTWTGHRQ
ncbi:MAG: alcohol dehydrogenase catalytic domain-containing protein [Bacteroidota bacterium]